MIKLDTKTILTLIVIVIFFIAGFFVSKYFSDKKENKEIQKLRTQIVRNDKLVKIDSTTYKKLVADTLTKKQLKQKIDSLEIEVKEPEVVQEIVFVPKEAKTKVDTVTVKDTTVNIVDFYPQKENYFIKYSSTINTLKQTATSNWSFKPKKISLAIGLDDNGMYEVKTKVPEFINISSIDVQTQPKKVISKDNFGYLIGGGYGLNLGNENNYFSLNTGIRYKKNYLLLNVGTNETVSAGLTIEF